MPIRQHHPRLALFSLLLAGVLIGGCSQGFVQYQATPIPADVTELFRTLNSVESDTVWIFEQGGPKHEFDPFAYDSFVHYPGREEVQFVQVHQTLTLNHDLAEREGEWLLADLQAEVDVSVEILDRTIKHFKAQDKRVVVVGHSYGAFLLARYLALRGPEAADQYLLMAGRLDMPDQVVQGFLTGTVYWFPDAINPQPFPDQQFLPPKTPRERMEMRIAAATGHDRYTTELAGTDMRKVVYVYGTLDMIVGRLTDAEVLFLESAGSTVIAVQDGGHRAMFEDPNAARRISDALNQ
ncbi:MAG: alpha/beta hydrolase [Spirochaetaceae bacterium]|nr:alpha/beta hydrolase [Spirochaetaceae bacterium]